MSSTIESPSKLMEKTESGNHAVSSHLEGESLKTATAGSKESSKVGKDIFQYMSYSNVGDSSKDVAGSHISETMDSNDSINGTAGYTNFYGSISGNTFTQASLINSSSPVMDHALNPGMDVGTSFSDSKSFVEASRDPRQRTQSIEQFLSQSPSHALGRKKFTPPDSNNDSAEMTAASIDESLGMLARQSSEAAIGLDSTNEAKSLHKHLDALDLNMDRQLFSHSDSPQLSYYGLHTRGSNLMKEDVGEEITGLYSSESGKFSVEDRLMSSTPPPPKSSPLHDPLQSSGLSSPTSETLGLSTYGSPTKQSLMHGPNGGSPRPGSSELENNSRHSLAESSNLLGSSQFGSHTSSFIGDHDLGYESYSHHGAQQSLNPSLGGYSQQSQYQPMMVQSLASGDVGVSQSGYYSIPPPPNSRHASQQVPPNTGVESMEGGKTVTGLQPMQQLVLPNGMQAMVVPMVPGGMNMQWNGMVPTMMVSGQHQSQPAQQQHVQHMHSSQMQQAQYDDSMYGLRMDGSLRQPMGRVKMQSRSHMSNPRGVEGGVSRSRGMGHNHKGTSHHSRQIRVTGKPVSKLGHSVTSHQGNMRGGKGANKRGDPSGEGGRVFAPGNPVEDEVSAGVSIPPETPLSEYKDKLYQLSQEQNGCRYLQQKVDAKGAEACTQILEEVQPRLVQLMMDPFGNYLFQKLLEHVTPVQRMDMLNQVRNHLVQAALNLHGTRSVQKFIEVCGGSNGKRTPDLEQLNVLVECLSPFVTKLSMDTNGNHVVQRCLQHMPVDIVQFVYDAAIKDVLVITRHRHGCCVFQRCIDAANEKQRRALVTQVVNNAIQLMQDPFGNYVVQYVLDNSKKQEADALIMQLLGMLAQLSMQKFSSNVVEKCLLAAPAHVKEPMIKELANPETMRNLLHDQFANYVVQRALQVADDEQGMHLVASIRPHIADLGQFNPSCARRVTSRVIKRFPNLAKDPVFAAFWQNEGAV